MPNLSAAWKYFYKANHKYKADTVHWACWCKACIDFDVGLQREIELNASVDGSIAFARSVEAIRDEVCLRTAEMCGKTDKMWNHLAKCSHIDEEGKTAASQIIGARNTRTSSSHIPTPTRIPPGQRFPSNSLSQPEYAPDTPLSLQERAALVIQNIDPDSGRPLTRQRTEEDVFYGKHTSRSSFWPQHVQETFAAELCVLMIICNTAWWNVEHPYWRAFFSKWVPQSIMPGRKELSGRILDAQAGKVEEKMRVKAQGRYGTGQCDGWKNVSKTSLIASMVNVEYTPYILNTFDVSPVHKTAENLLKIVLDEIRYVLSLGILLVAWCTDASGESSKMRRLLKRRLPWIITVDCWAHQINLIVGDVFKLKGIFVSMVDKALEVVKWFNNHSRALGLLRDVTRARLSKVLALILPIITRWTSHYLSVRRLLELENCFKQLLLDKHDEVRLCAGDTTDAKRKADEVLSIIESSDFWNDLRRIKKHIEPLAIATNVTQSDFAHLDVVLITMFHLYHYYSDPSLDEGVRHAVLKSLEKRWKKQDQDIFILALLLNPYIRASCFADDCEFRSFNRAWRLFVAVYKRIFHTMEEPDFECRQAFNQYFHGIGAFSDDAMFLAAHQNAADQAKQPVNLVELWRELDNTADPSTTPPKYSLDDLGPPPQGKIALVRLAMKIFSIVPNSTATERLFSQFGIVHTKHRNRLQPEKVRKTVLIRSDVAKEYGSGPSSRKRKFYTDNDTVFVTNTAQAESTPSSSHPPLPDTPMHDSSADDGEFRRLVDDIGEENREMEEVDPAAEDVPSFYGDSYDQPMLLRNLFRFPPPGQPLPGSMIKLVQFWKAGEAGMQTEIDFHDTVLALGSEGE